MKRPHISPALLVSLVALFVSLGGTAWAATGGNFILGQGNNATTQTGLTANFAGKTLQLTNTSTATGATPLGLTPGAGRPPFQTPSTTKVANLNADKLDGYDSTAFTHGANTTILANRLVVPVPTSGSSTPTVLTIPGLGSLNATCDATPFAGITYKNTSSNTVDGWLSDSGSGWSEDIYPPNATVGAFGIEAELGLGTGAAAGARTFATVQTFSVLANNNADCVFQAQATVWHG
jgi:hypothetical protein